jgi:hypothetical protein
LKKLKANGVLFSSSCRVDGRWAIQQESKAKQAKLQGFSRGALFDGLSRLPSDGLAIRSPKSIGHTSQVLLFRRGFVIILLAIKPLIAKATYMDFLHGI